MKLSLLVLASLFLFGCATGIGKKISQETLDQLQAGKGKLTKDQVRAKIGAPPIAQLEREGLMCDSYTYSGMVNYFIFTTSDKAQSYNFCYDNTDKLKKVDGLQM